MQSLVSGGGGEGAAARAHSVGGGRRIADAVAKARGRAPLKYEICIIPFFCSELPSGLERLSFVWERGHKVFATNAERVNPHTRAVFWSQHLRQTMTVYHDGNSFVSKEYTLKVQAVTHRGAGHEERRTVGKARIDLSAYCNAEVEPLPREVFLQLKPAGKLKVSIKAGWLKDAPIDADAMSEGSGFTGISGDGGFAPSGGGGSLPPHAGRGGEEQDLSGFEAASGGSVLGEGPLQRKSFLGDSGRSAVGGPRPGGVAGAAHASGGAATRGHDRGAGGVPRPESSAGSATGSPRIPALGGSVGRGRRGSAAAAGEIPPFEPPLSAEQQRAEIERQKAAVMVAAQEQIDAMRRDMEAAFKVEVQLAAAQRRGICARARDLLCCCWPRGGAAGGKEQDAAATELAAAAASMPDWNTACGARAPMHPAGGSSSRPTLPPTSADL